VTDVRWSLKELRAKAASMSVLLRARRNPFATETQHKEFDQVVAKVRAKGHKCIVSAPTGDSGSSCSSDSQDIASDFIVCGASTRTVVLWLDLANNQGLSQETHAVLEDKVAKIRDSRVLVMVRIKSMDAFEECQVRSPATGGCLRHT